MGRPPHPVARDREVAGDLRRVWARLDSDAARAAWLADPLPTGGDVVDRTPPRRVTWGDEAGLRVTAELVPVTERRTRVRLTAASGRRGWRRRSQHARALTDALEASLRALDAQLRAAA